ncbi:hypothetical protein AKJ09_01460 [Labilithrix luteola]|uniref:Uncharacterized protein n=1 Tax=Labilithrix luteola TaxID=1391654 RepID=A0A0K1PN30_9BACT|nr:hypothetical protein AKJ09_01460 [Labilithrix luteola]
MRLAALTRRSEESLARRSAPSCLEVGASPVCRDGIGRSRRV